MKKALVALLVVGATFSFAADGKALYAKCVACHGAKAEKPGLGKGKAPAAMTKDEIVKDLKDYKAGTRNAYGMGALMKGNVATYSDEDIEAVAAYIKSL